MEDAAIVQLYWDREERAIAESDRKYGIFCIRMAQNILNSSQDAEECVNDTWHRAWDTMPPQRPENLRAYLGRIVRNLSIDRWRRGRAQKRGEGMELMLSELEGCLPGGPTPEQELENREITRAIEGWLDTLTREERALFLGRYWYGERVDALSRRWSCTPNAMAQRLLRLRSGLRRWLEEKEVAV
ncbi:MAG: sigma-70 family RNA polymerase sigma factor [Lawsonibacter sp.]|nr:sigma-70 family RNA polymerase sigma factor [Lawsonibacter sp.]